MQSLFTGSGYPYIERSMVREDMGQIRRLHRRVMVRYMTGNQTTNNSHILVSLLKNIDTNETDTNEYIRIGLAKFNNYNSSNVFTTETKVGTMDYGLFTNYNVLEGILATTNNPSFQMKQLTVEDISPMRVLYHPYSGIDLPIMDSNWISEPMDDKIPIALYHLDIGLLLLQYKMYKDLYQGTIRHFVYAFVLTTMGNTYLPIALFNRAVANSTGKPVDSNWSYSLTMSTDLSVRSLEKYLSKRELRRRRFTKFEDMLYAVPTMDSVSFLDIIRLDGIISTPMNRALLFMVQFLIFSKLVDFVDEKVFRKDRSVANDYMKVSDKVIRYDRLRKYMPDEALGKMMDQVKELHTIVDVLT